MKQISYFLKNLLHLAFPLADRLLPAGPVQRLVGGLASLPVRLVPLAIGFAVYLSLIYLGEFLISEILYRFVVLLKLPKVFRIEWLEPSFFAMLGYQFRRAGLVLLGIYAAIQLLGTAGSAVYLTAREIIVLKRWPFSVSIIRIPLAAVRYALFTQIPGERLLTTGRITLAWSDRETLTLPGVPRGEHKLAMIMEKLPGGGPDQHHSGNGRGRENKRNHPRTNEHQRNRNEAQQNNQNNSPRNSNDDTHERQNDSLEHSNSGRQGSGRRRKRGRGRGRSRQDNQD